MISDIFDSREYIYVLFSYEHYQSPIGGWVSINFFKKVPLFQIFYF